MITVKLSDYEWDHIMQVLTHRRDDYNNLAKYFGKRMFGDRAREHAKREQAIIDTFVEAKK